MARTPLSRHFSPSSVDSRRAKTTRNISERSGKNALLATTAADCGRSRPAQIPTWSLAMTDLLDSVRDHYRATGRTERMKTALAIYGPEDQRLTPQQLAPLDQFHTLGLAAIAELGKLAWITSDMSVLDVGSGVGRPARFLATTHGCRVTGVDLSEPFVEAARYLTERTGQSGRVSFETGSALALPFADGSFDAVLLQHVAMNIENRTQLYDEIRRVLKTGGSFATFDVVALGGAPHFPVPWARTPATSFLLTEAATRAAIEAAGFRA